VGVEKGNKEVISAHFSVSTGRRFNKLQQEFWRKTYPKEFFNSHACLQHLSLGLHGGNCRDFYSAAG
jgi:hypothetical protein